MTLGAALIVVALGAALLFYPGRTLVLAAGLVAVFLGAMAVNNWSKEQTRRERLIAERHCPAELAAFRRADAGQRAEREAEAQNCVRRHLAFGGLYAPARIAQEHAAYVEEQCWHQRQAYLQAQENVAKAADEFMSGLMRARAVQAEVVFEGCIEKASRHAAR